MTDTRTYAFYSLDLNGNDIVEGNGFNLPVEGEYPLQVVTRSRFTLEPLHTLAPTGPVEGFSRTPLMAARFMEATQYSLIAEIRSLNP